MNNFYSNANVTLFLIPHKKKINSFGDVPSPECVIQKEQEEISN